MKKLLLISVLLASAAAHADPAEVLSCGNQAQCQAGNSCTSPGLNWPITMQFDHADTTGNEAAIGTYTLKGAKIENGDFICMFEPTNKGTNTAQIVFKTSQPSPSYTPIYGSYWSNHMCNSTISENCKVTINK